MRRVLRLQPHSLHRRPVDLRREVVQVRIEYTHDGGDRWEGTSYVPVLRVNTKNLSPIDIGRPRLRFIASDQIANADLKTFSSEIISQM
ncbi:hypothetical protein GCM10008992_31600 [Halorubrum aquaticum]